MSTVPRVLLLSSNLRRQYTEDILAALALPPGSIIQFRYGADYVCTGLQRCVADKSILGADAVLAFVSDQEKPQPFLLPVRHARVSAATVARDTFFFRLRVQEYPNLGDYPVQEPEIRAASAPRMSQIITGSGGTFRPATVNGPSLGLRDNGDPADRWGSVVQRLSTHTTFQNSFFMRVEPPLDQAGKPLTFAADGRLQLVDQKSARIPVSFYSEVYRPTDGYTLTCSTDGTFLRVSSDEAYDIALRYDAVEFWVHPAVNTFDTLARVTIAMKPQNPAGTAGDPVPAYARLPVLVKRSRSRLATRSITSGSGAALVALPAILGPGAPLPLRILLAAIGAVLIAVAAVILSPTGR